MEDLGSEAERWMPFVVSVASRFLGSGAERNDLIQSGAVGLMKALEKYGAEDRASFAAYAFKYIEGEIRGFLRNNRLIAVPRTTMNKIVQLKALMRSCEQIGESMRVFDAAEKLAASESEIVSLILLTDGIQSLAPLSDAGGCYLLSDGSLFEERLTEKLMLRDAAERLSVFERAVVRLRFSADKTQSETAKLLKVSQSAVSKAESKAVQKLRDILVNEDLWE